MPGRLVHFELPSRDTARARGFWGGLFGWSFGNPGTTGMEYWMAQTAAEQGGAIYPSEQSGIVVYFDTADIDASIAKVRELGGTAEDKSPIPQIGWFTRCTDTEGNAFSLFQGDEPVAE